MRSDPRQLQLWHEPKVPLPGSIADADSFTLHVCTDYPTCPYGEECRNQPIGADAVCLRAERSPKPPARPLRTPPTAA